jgi:prepilin-type N-terminal cleavage/methylation domain-containing protein
MWERMSEKRNEGGFTLIELLIVIIILAILAAIVVFAVGSTGQNAKTAACNSDAKTFETALETYKAEVGFYPGDPNLTTNTGGPAIPNQGQTWGSAIAMTRAATLSPMTTMPNPPAPGNGVYGLLGDNGTEANGALNTASDPGGSWIAPNGSTIGPFLRTLPQSTHYQIWTDGQGGVFVFPPPSTYTVNPSTSFTSANNFDITPGICQTAPV